MKPKLLACLFLTMGFAAQAQTKYIFDHLLEYKKYYPESSEIFTVYYLTNSKDNSYYLSFKEKKTDSTSFKFEFIDQKGTFAGFETRKTTFENAATIILPCAGVVPFSNPYKYQVKNYAFEQLKDTLLKEFPYSHYIIKCTRSDRYKKRNELGTTHFIFKKNRISHLFFYTHQTEYEEWKISGKTPNGIPKVKFYVAYGGGLLYKSTLLKVEKINKTIFVSKECDYADNQD